MDVLEFCGDDVELLACYEDVNILWKLLNVAEVLTFCGSSCVLRRNQYAVEVILC